ncbi:MAG: hypothetical protein GXO25_00535 [Euryarchaeota archaeon]|nr:hypothetical protein [Euryarchaeota archaeon]
MILITAFEKFGKYDRNPSMDVLEEINHRNIMKKVVPVTYKDAKEMPEVFLNDKIDAILAMGFAPARPQISVEGIALNTMNSGMPDNNGVVATLEKLFPDGPMAYTTLQIASYLVGELKDSGIPAYISYSAGTYVCNALFYSFNYWIEKKNLEIPVVFVHIPPDEKMAVENQNFSFVERKTMVSAITRIIELLQTKDFSNFTW